MRRLYLAAAVIVLISGLATSAPASAGPVGGIQGIVVDSAGDPLKGVALELNNAGWVKTTSQSDGTFEYDAIAPGDYYSICGTGVSATGGASQTGYVDSCVYPVSVQAGQVTTAVKVVMQSAGSISGTVTDSRGHPLGHVGVQLDGFDSQGQMSTFQALTGSDGKYRVTELPIEFFTACFDASSAVGGTSAYGYVDQCWKQHAGPDYGGRDDSQLTRIPVAAGAVVSGVDAALGDAGAISGTVTDASGNPIAGVTVNVGSSPDAGFGTATTAANGAYDISQLPPDHYTLTLDASQATGGSSSVGYINGVYVGPGKPAETLNSPNVTLVDVTSGASSAIDPEIPAAAEITGTVTDYSGNPIAGIEVSGTDDSTQAVTGADGKYTLALTYTDGTFFGTHLPTTPTRILFQPSGASDYVRTYYPNAYSPDQFTLGSPTEVTPVAGRATVINEKLLTAGSLQGTVRDSLSGDPISGARVTAYVGTTPVSNYSLTTGQDGTYSVQGLPPDNYTLCLDNSLATTTVSPAGYFDECYDGSTETNPVTVNLAVGQKRSGVDLTPTRAAGISGTVTDAHGRGIRGEGVNFFHNGVQVQVQTFTDTNGTYRSPRLDPGVYTVCAHDLMGRTGYRYPDICYGQRVPGGPGAPVTTAAGQITSVNLTVPASAAAQGAYVTLSQTRLLDTRKGIGAPARPLTSGHLVRLALNGVVGGPPAGTTAAMLNVTVTSTTGGGYLTVWADGGPRPAASNLNWVRGQTVANLAAVPIGQDGSVDLMMFGGGTANVLADISGYYLAVNDGDSTPGTYRPLTAARVLDTRTGVGARPLAAGSTALFQLDGAAGGPPQGTIQAVVNLTVTSPTSDGYLTVFASGTAKPATSNINWSTGQTVANLAIVPVGADGKIAVFIGGRGSAQVIADVAGYFLPDDGQPPVDGALVGLNPSRLFDTRTGVGGPAGVVPAGATRTFVVAGTTGGAPTGSAAVVVNLTVTQSAGDGYLTAWGDGLPRPGVSSINWSKGQTVANLAILPVGSDGKITLFVGGTGSVHVVADIVGYYAMT